MLRRPPEILITPGKPQSADRSPNSRLILSGVKTILDEVHAVLDSKRRSHLITAVDRLVLWRGIPAPCPLRYRPATGAGRRFVGGFTAHHNGTDWHYEQRPVTILKSTQQKQYKLTVETLPQVDDGGEKDALWQKLAALLAGVVRETAPLWCLAITAARWKK